MHALKKAAIAGLLLSTCSIASALTLQSAPVNADGSSKLVDPDAQTERLADQQRSVYSRGRYRDFQDSSSDARDSVRMPANDGRAMMPLH
jgi:hypothetical protein